jgi:hypothetical protein
LRFFHLEGKMAQCVALSATCLSRAEVSLVASLGDIALESQAGIRRILYFLLQDSPIFPEVWCECSVGEIVITIAFAILFLHFHVSPQLIEGCPLAHPPVYQWLFLHAHFYARIALVRSPLYFNRDRERRYCHDRCTRQGESRSRLNPDTLGTNNTTASPGKLAAEFADLRQASLPVLEHVAPQDFNRTAEHSELGTVTLGQLLHEWAAHDLNHTQAERAVMQPFMQGCGPWRSYFRDHEVTNR